MNDYDSNSTGDVELADVIRGAAWLDTQLPGWEDKIDPSTLFMMSCYGCILGQTFGPQKYNEVMDAFGGTWIIRHGFVGGSNVRDMWIDVITERTVLRELEASSAA